MNPADEIISTDDLHEMFSGSIRSKIEVDFYLNGNIDHRAALFMRMEGIELTDVQEQGQSEEDSDIRILARARMMGCVLVTADRDFREIHERIMGAKVLSHAGILFVRSDTLKSDPIQLAGVLIRIAQKYEGGPNLLYSQLFQL